MAHHEEESRKCHLNFDCRLNLIIRLQCPVCKADVTNPRRVQCDGVDAHPADSEGEQHTSISDPQPPNELTPLLPVSSS